MKKNLFKMMLATVAVVAGSVSICNSQKECCMSDIALSNVEALALIEEVLDDRTPSDIYQSMELLGGGCTRVTYERLCAYGGSSPCTPGVHTEVICLR